MKYLTSDYKPAPLPFYMHLQYYIHAVFNTFSDQPIYQYYHVPQHYCTLGKKNTKIIGM